MCTERKAKLAGLYLLLSYLSRWHRGPGLLLGLGFCLPLLPLCLPGLLLPLTSHLEVGVGPEPAEGI